jgi:hypothetical protein
VFTTRYA